MNELPEEKYSEPFNEPLINSNVSDKIKTFRNNPELVVKEMTLDDKNLENVLKRLADERKLCEDICKEYDIATPNIYYAIGESSKFKYDDISIYQIKDNVHGLILSDLPPNNFNEAETIEFKEEAEKLLITLSQYMMNTAKNGGLWLHDIFYPRQWVYGKRKGETKNKMYLIDVDDFEKYIHDPQNLDEEVMYLINLGKLVSIATMITKIEKYLGGNRLENARDKLIIATKEILSDSPEHKGIRMSVEEVLARK
jgi:hypothetical protein